MKQWTRPIGFRESNVLTCRVQKISQQHQQQLLIGTRKSLHVITVWYFVQTMSYCEVMTPSNKPMNHPNFSWIIAMLHMTACHFIRRWSRNCCVSHSDVTVVLFVCLVLSSSPSQLSLSLPPCLILTDRALCFEALWRHSPWGSSVMSWLLRCWTLPVSPSDGGLVEVNVEWPSVKYTFPSCS